MGRLFVRGLACTLPSADRRNQDYTVLGVVTMLLVGKPGPVRDALQIMIQAILGLPALATADTGLLAWKAIREMYPRLVLIAGGLPDAEVLELIRLVKQEHPGTACLVLTVMSQQRQLAQAAGADRVLPDGSPFGELATAIRELCRPLPSLAYPAL